MRGAYPIWPGLWLSLPGSVDSFPGGLLGVSPCCILVTQTTMIRVSSPFPQLQSRNSPPLLTSYSRNMDHSWHPYFPLLCIWRWFFTPEPILWNDRQCVDLCFVYWSNKWISSRKLMSGLLGTCSPPWCRSKSLCSDFVTAIIGGPISHLSRMLLMELQTFNIAPWWVTMKITYTGSGSIWGGYIAMRRNFRHFRSIKELELVYVFSVRFFSVPCASINFTSDVVL